MRHTTRLRAELARYLLATPNDGLRRRVAILRETQYPPGSYSLAASVDWEALQVLLSNQQQGFIYGGADNALVFTYDARANLVTILFGIVDGVIVGKGSSR